ncbi:MAG: zf-TFIIB domain-containing protein [Balneolaceae bacterium]
MKKCPVCEVKLNRVRLADEQPAFKCSNCEGTWISYHEYVQWIGPGQKNSIDVIDTDYEVPLPVFENRKALLCPDCERILRRFKIWPNVEFHLDRCGYCNGIWFDKNEWEVLKLKGLEKYIHIFFTEAWQKKLKSEEMTVHFREMYKEKFGLVNYKKIKEVKSWLQDEELESELLAYLTNKNPYRG